MPVLLNPVIISLPWIREDNIIIEPVTNTLIINSYGLTISTKEICHGASYMQANGAEGRKNDRLKKEKEGKGIVTGRVACK